MPKLPIKKKLDADPEKKPNTAGNWEGFARNIAAGMNQTQAYIAAGYSENGARQSAAVLVRKPHVQKLLWELGQKADIEPVSILRTLNEQANASLEDFLDDEGRYTLEYVRGTDKMRLIKSIVHDQDGKIVNIELYSSQVAAIALLKVSGLEQAPRMNDADYDRLKRLAMDQLQLVMEKFNFTREQGIEYMREYVKPAMKYLM